MKEIQSFEISCTYLNIEHLWKEFDRLDHICSSANQERLTTVCWVIELTDTVIFSTLGGLDNVVKLWDVKKIFAEAESEDFNTAHQVQQ